MAMSHSSCGHPRTPAARAACRKTGGPAADTPTPGKPTTRFVMTHADGCTQPDQQHSNGRCPVDAPSSQPRVCKVCTESTGKLTRIIGGWVHIACHNGPVKLASKGLKRPGTQLRTDGDLPDVPRSFTVAIRTAWKRGWIVRVGEQFNDTERRIEVFGTYAVVSLVWKDSNPHGLNGVFLRKLNVSYGTKVGSVNEALRLAAGE